MSIVDKKMSIAIQCFAPSTELGAVQCKKQHMKEISLPRYLERPGVNTQKFVV